MRYASNINFTLGIPNWVSNYAIVTFFASLTVSMMLGGYILDWYWLLFGIVEVFAFFYGTRFFYRKWSSFADKHFERTLLIVSFVIRSFALLVFLLLYSYMGAEYGYNANDSGAYIDLAKYSANLMMDGKGAIVSRLQDYSGVEFSDVGYSLYLGFIYRIVGYDNAVFFVKLLKLIYSAWTVLMMYRLARNNFGEEVGRMTGIFCMLMPNLMVYNSLILKESEMVFLVVLFISQSDEMLRTRNFSIWKLLPLLLVAFLLFTLRTALAIVSVFALLLAILMSSSRIMGWGKRILIGGIALLFIGYTMGDRIWSEANNLYKNVGNQKSNMEWRSQRADAGGHHNKFAKYAGATVFAPLIFTIPFPTMVNVDGQEYQKMMHGGYFIKNILSGFVIFAMFFLLLSRKWHEHVLPLAFFVGYLIVLTFSNFAQSERFHQPILPFSMMFASYGLCLVKSGAMLSTKIRYTSMSKYKNWYNYWCVFMFVAIVVWSWFKLKGRGMI